MTPAEVVVLAFALAMDAVAVSLAEGLRLRRPRFRDAFLIAGMFGLFQGLMPVLGWLLAFGFADAVSSATPWIAFGMLALIGAHMIKESFEDDDDHGATSVVTVRTVTPLAIATSIDAAAVGVTFGVLEVQVAPAVAVIGVITCVLSLGAVYVGARVGERLGRWATLVGGVILVLIGLRILLAHLLG
ncbi:manganese efflux pump MntP [Nocardioides bizhenqiangii]|uniref:Putative manganese efflux pump MntP n=1 Tax=Nocardioides bizhenqiangii TaxID=3095076 RepID=A0ABZ0ZWP3_9ACTN|nr:MULTISPECIES: manganese efflux pump MntP family protein [unclassified Nocardioides]MDZ5622434.1 manganese efflux pump MntP family protein [Nocardioides sp. HM23]WQQ28399.1 manganese efflux pump MntP family protein [Nocardioides sp. HM61]